MRRAMLLWQLVPDPQRAEAAEAMRPGLVEMAVDTFGARDAGEVRVVLEIVVAGCRAELDADVPTPLPVRPRSKVRLRR